MKRLLSSTSQNDLLRLLNAWKIWLLVSLFGSVIALFAYYIFPPDYRAMATVVVDFNVEESWEQIPDRELFYFLEREARKLVEVAWADETLEAVAQPFDDITIVSLRKERLYLSQPKDGAWHFYAEDANSARAEKIATLWAQSFYEQAKEGAMSALALDSLNTALENGEVDLKNVEEDIKRLETETLGINSYLQLSLSQTRNLPVNRKTSLGEYIFFGATGMLFLSALTFLFSRKDNA